MTNFWVQAKERYTAGFDNIRTKNPFLFVGSPFDPLTPLASARNVSAGFEGSVVLQHNGYGVRQRLPLSYLPDLLTRGYSTVQYRSPLSVRP